MFDKLVESDTTGADFKKRGRYFMVSSVVVGILFLSAVVYSLYAADIGLGNGNFEIAELLAPVSSEVPEQVAPQQPSSPAQSSSSPRNVNTAIASLDQPTLVPTLDSTTQKAPPSQGLTQFDPLKPVSLGNGGPAGPGAGVTTGTSSANGLKPDPQVLDDRTAEPPPALKAKPDVVRKSHLLNGEAISLPKPAYPQTAVTLNLQGTVSVQVTIDERGNVISAKAADGHPFFRGISEQAARNAKFKPTILNDQPVKVTGVIVYRFKRN